MGCWGTGIYSNDFACDIRAEYIDGLKRGKSNEEMTEKVENMFGRDLDEDEEPIFWFTLADMQWNYGRLLPHVKEKALYFIDQPYELTRWQEAGNEKSGQWKATLTKLRNKLNSEQPPEKKIYKYRLYKCEWKLGDCFAYQFKGEYAKEKGYEGKYIVFRKVTEYNEHPGHILPGIKFFCTTFDEVPKLDELNSINYLRANFLPIAYFKNPKIPKYYDMILGNTSKRVIPKDLIYLGNIGGNDLIPYDEDRNYHRGGVGWLNQRYGRDIENYFITFFEAWKDIENEKELGVD